MITCLSAGASAKSAGIDQARPAGQLAKATSELVNAANQYKTTVQALIPIYENNLKSAAESIEKRKELFAQGLISKLDLEAGEQAVKTAQTQLDQTREQLTQADQMIAEANAQLAKPASPARTGRYATNAAVMRYSGAGGWAITQASRVGNFFASTLTGSFLSAPLVSRRLTTDWASITTTPSMSQCILIAPRARR